MRKELTKIKQLIKPYGYTLTQARGHYKIQNQQGHLLAVVSCSPSDGHWYKNVVKDLKRRGYIT